MLAGTKVRAFHGTSTVLPDIDFETSSDAGYVYDFNERKWGSLPGYDAQNRGLGAVGTRIYVEHWSFRPLMISWNLKDGGPAGQWEPGEDPVILEPLFEYIRAGGLMEAQNSMFEFTVWNCYCFPVLGWPEIKIEQMRCSASKLRAAGFPGSLGPAGEVLDIEHKKDKEGERLMKIFSMPHNPTKKDPTTHTLPWQAPLEWQAYKAYNRTDIVAESEVSILCPDLSPFELDVWLEDQRINFRGMQVDSFNVDNCIAIVEQAYERYGAECRALTGGIEPTELQQLLAWLHGQGVHLDNMQAKTIEAAVERLTPLGYSPGLRVLQLRQMLGSASVKKLFSLRARTCRSGRVYDMYLYMATHHGRWGGYGPQPQNLYKGDWHTPEEVDAALKVLASRDLATVEAAYPGLSALDVVNNVLRSLFIAAPGHRLVSSDYSAIEAVCLAALSGEQWVLDVLATHGMIYEATISRMSGIPFEDFVKHRVDTGGIATYSPDGKLLSIKGGKHHPLRQQGKLADLSGGYASWIGGWKKFGADKYYKSDYEMKQAILSYRAARPATEEFWGGQTRDKFRDSCRQEYYGLEGAAISAVLNPGTCYRVGLIAFQMDAGDDVLYMQLPSGRLIAYHTPRLTPATRDYAEPWELALSYWGWNTNPDKGPPAWIQMDLYGGVLTQNACGGTARDIMAHGMLNVARKGYPIVMHTHDEAVAEVPIGFGSVIEFETELNDLPAYAKAWPIFAKGGWEGPRYGKWD